MPFVTETLWKTLTGGESLVIAEWPQPSGFAVGSVAAQRIADMQKLVTEVRRFRSDQGLNDRQRVPARLSASPRPIWTPGGGRHALAWLTPPADGFTPSAAVEVRLSAARCSSNWTPRAPSTWLPSGAAGEGSRRRAEGTGADDRQARQRGVPGEGARRRRRQDPRPPAGGPGRSRADHRPARGSLSMTATRPDTGRDRGAAPGGAPARPAVARDQDRAEHRPDLGADGAARLASARATRRSTSPAPTARRRWPGSSTRC